MAAAGYRRHISNRMQQILAKENKNWAHEKCWKTDYDFFFFRYSLSLFLHGSGRDFRLRSWLSLNNLFTYIFIWIMEYFPSAISFLLLLTAKNGLCATRHHSLCLSHLQFLLYINPENFPFLLIFMIQLPMTLLPNNSSSLFAFPIFIVQLSRTSFSNFCDIFSLSLARSEPNR